MTKHPCKFTDPLLPFIADLLTVGGAGPGSTVLDPMAGSGKGVDYLHDRGWLARGIELEPEWASMSAHVDQGNALALPWSGPCWDGAFTSPTYGNRMADVDLRESAAGNYAKSLGRRASAGSSCHIQWGTTYQSFHEAVWRELDRVLLPGAPFVLNCKDHIRDKERQRVTAWHVEFFESLGYAYRYVREVPVPSMRWGTNAASRMPVEYVVLLQKAV